uniref:CCA tRNA nucleotidyltransferase n=1 Tax=Elioraea rosea TaxID=2492390 RepID=UPI001186124E|nr:CCA tRNA nucleotidyltransferase [Elioraea rosea]
MLAEPGVAAVLDALPKARLVGGAVRDVLAGRPVADIDLATPDAPEAVTEALSRAGIRVVPTGIAHGTVTAVAGGRPVEITTLRRDVDTDGRHATVAYTDDWREDAARRDFTINAMSMERDGLVHDWFGGREDLAAGRVRFVGEAALRIAEDYLRALRFFRFHARYGRGTPDDEAITAIAAAVPGLARLSAERVWSELKRILAAPDPVASIRLMRETGVMEAVLPRAGGEARLAGLIRAGAPADALLRLAALAPGDVPSLAARLRLSGEEAARLESAEGPLPRPEDDDAALRRALADTPAAALADRAWLAEASGAAGDWSGLRARLAAIEPPRFPLAGADVVAAGIPPGPDVGRILAALRADWLAAGCTGARDAWIDALRTRVSPTG